ncbi:MAG: hypothetical protein RMK01_02150 [Thermomicrobium sp.]|nr:hypothetical protein [Thermomicrobium sp.]MDW8058859.1 hypothetical protein [Thermomicrobium sp.]
MQPNHQSPIDVIQHAMREIVSLHRITVQQLGELIRVQSETTGQLHGVTDAMREIGALFREMTGAQGRVNEFMTVLADQLQKMAEIDGTMRQAVVALVDQFEQVAGQLAGVHVLLRQVLRDQERLSLAVLGQEIEQRAPSLFCRYLTRMRWGVPGTFYDEVEPALSDAGLDLWLEARLVVHGSVRRERPGEPLWVVLWIVPELDESVVSRVAEQAGQLRRELGRVVPAVAPLRSEYPTDAAVARGVLVVTETGIADWDRVLGYWQGSGAS